MSIFFSPSRASFFDERIHGPRLIMVVDEDRLAELQAECLEEGEESDACAQLSLAPPTKAIDNPTCRIPKDAVPVGEEDYRAVLEEMGLGKVPALDGDRVVAVERGLPLDVQLADLRYRRDRELARTDWTQAPDALTAAKRKLWAEHRQALRDLPARVEAAVKEGRDPASVTFPEAPAEKKTKAPAEEAKG